jgi:hypothetical protein
VSRLTRLARPAAVALAGAGACALALSLAGWRPPSSPPPPPEPPPVPATLVTDGWTAIMIGEVVDVVPVPAEFHTPPSDGKPTLILEGDDGRGIVAWAQGSTHAAILRRGTAGRAVCFFPTGAINHFHFESGDTVAIRGQIAGGPKDRPHVVNCTLLGRQPRGTPIP